MIYILLLVLQCKYHDQVIHNPQVTWKIPPCLNAKIRLEISKVVFFYFFHLQYNLSIELNHLRVSNQKCNVPANTQFACTINKRIINFTVIQNVGVNYTII